MQRFRIRGRLGFVDARLAGGVQLPTFALAAIDFDEFAVAAI